MKLTRVRITVRQTILLVALVAIVFGAERWGESRGEKLAYHRFHHTWRSIVVKRGGNYELLFSGDTSYPDVALDLRQKEARLKAEGVDYRIEEEVRSAQ